MNCAHAPSLSIILWLAGWIYVSMEYIWNTVVKLETLHRALLLIKIKKCLFLGDMYCVWFSGLPGRPALWLTACHWLAIYWNRRNVEMSNKATTNAHQVQHTLGMTGWMMVVQYHGPRNSQIWSCEGLVNSSNSSMQQRGNRHRTGSADVQG